MTTRESQRHDSHADSLNDDVAPAVTNWLGGDESHLWWVWPLLSGLLAVILITIASKG